MLRFVFSVSNTEEMFIYVIQILSNLLYAGGQMDTYTEDQINKSKTFYAEFIFTYMENHLDI